jgi:hypothetical protein
MTVRIPAFVAAIALTAGVLAGCAATPSDIASGTAAQLQTTVVSIAETVAAGDAAGALTQLDVLQQQLDAAVAEGSVSAERAGAIQTRIDVVRADLQPAPLPTVEPAPEPTPDQTVDDGGDDGGGDDGGNDNSGPGNNSGNDNGSGSGKDKDKDD